MACDQRKPEHLVVAKHGNPLWMHFHEPWEALVFSSRYVFLRKVFGEFFNREPLPADRLMLFDALQLPSAGRMPAWAVPLSC